MSESRVRIIARSDPSARIRRPVGGGKAASRNGGWFRFEEEQMKEAP